MRKSIALLLAFVFLTASCTVAFKPVQASSADSWASKASLHEARALLGVAVVNGKIYAIGGNNQSNGNIQCVDTNEEYDPATDTWTFKKPMPTPRASFGIAVYQNKIYVIGGFTGVEDAKYVLSGANEVYDPATDTWEIKASIPTPRMGMQANVVEGKIYVIGGNSSANEVYNLATDSWITQASMPAAPGLIWAWSCASVVVDDKIHVIGAFPRSNSHQIYDPVTDSWSFGTPVISGYWFAAAGTTAGVKAPKQIYVYGADRQWWDLTLPEFTSQSYDPVTSNWTACTSMPTPRINVGVAVVDDLVYVIGGETLMIGSNSDASAVNERYTPVGYGTLEPSDDGVAPEVAVLSPENKTYSDTDIPLNFAVDEPVSWMRYKLDAENAIEISGNITLTGLALGVHNLTVYAIDASGNVGASETVFFTVAEPEPFPTELVATASGASVVVVGSVLAIYFKKRKR